MHCWLVIVLIFQPAIGRSALKVAITSKDYQLSAIFNEFFKDQTTLRVFNFGPTPLILSERVIWSHNQNALKVLDDMGYGVGNPRTSIGYVVRSNFEFVKGDLENFARINTNGRWLLLMNDSIDILQVTSLLTNAWSTYNMLNILLVYQTSAYYYDPFATELVQLDLPSGSVNLSRFDARTKNVCGFPLKTEAVTRRMNYAHEDIFHVYDNLLDYVMRYINARPKEVPNLPVTSEVSIKSINGQFIGAHKRINESAIELSMLSQAVLDLGKSNVAYLYPTRRIKYFYVVRNRPLKPKIIEITVLDDHSATAEIVCLSAIVLMWFLFEHYRVDNFRRRHGFTRVVTDFLSITAGCSIRLFNGDQTSIRIIVWVLLFYSLIMNNTYQGQIVKKFSLPRKSENIKDLEELLATNYSLYSAFPTLMFRDSSSQTLQQLATKNLHISDLQEIFKISMNRSNVAFLATLHSINYNQAKHYNKITGDTFMHKIPIEVVDFMGSFLVRRDSAFLVEFNRAILQTFEAGLEVIADKQFKQKLALFKIKRQLTQFGDFEGNRKAKAIRFVNVEHIFDWYLYLLRIAVGMFLVEVVWFRIRRRLQKIRRFRWIISVLDAIGKLL